MPRLQVRRSAAGRYYWRLLSTNNRTVAVSCMDFADRMDCLAHAKLAVSTARARVPQVRQQSVDRWVWVLVDEGGQDVAQSYAAYRRRIECVNAIRRFGAAIAKDEAASAG
jgi:uncharacterized protein YegP (UPF0339 family)